MKPRNWSLVHTIMLILEKISNYFSFIAMDASAIVFLVRSVVMCDGMLNLFDGVSEHNEYLHVTLLDHRLLD